VITTVRIKKHFPHRLIDSVIKQMSFIGVVRYCFAVNCETVTRLNEGLPKDDFSELTVP